MKKQENNFAYIDGANLHKGVASLGWRLDYKRFRVWLSEKYGVKRAYLFLGLIPKYKELYKYLRTGAKISYINDQRSYLEMSQKEKAPDGDRTP